MPRRRFVIELESDAVVTRHSATTGQHQTLDYVPGACLLGAVAAHLYPKWSEDAFLAFHSGALRFGNAYPVSADGEPTLPAPLSWHHAKGESPVSEGRLNSERIANLASAERTGHVQWQALRQGWFAPGTGRWVDVPTTHRMKTAVSDRASDFGASAAGQLFGYSAIVAGTRLSGELVADDDFSKARWEELAEFLEDRELRIGRSRGAEFGKARIAFCADSDATLDLPEPGAEATDRVLVYAVSDLALTDQAEQPVLCPNAASLGLGDMQYVPACSFVRTRSYTPWNGYRKSPDLERHVIVQGSVIAFVRAAATPVAQHEAWVGAFQQDGLGHVLIDPAFLRKARPSFTGDPARVLDFGGSTANPKQAPAVLRIAERRYRDRQIELLAAELGQGWAKDWSRFTPSPSKSQWARLRAAAINSSSRGELLGALDDPHHGIFKHGLASIKWDRAMRGRTKLNERILADLRREPEAKLSEALGTDQGVDALALAACREAAISVASKQ